MVTLAKACFFISLAATSLLAQNRIQVENSQPGTAGWQLSNPAVDREIEGYASLTSVNIGNPISLFVSTSDSTFNVDFFRTGWYGGIGARRLKTVTNLPGQLQATPAPNPVTGLVECDWQISYTFFVPSDWTSGIFLARLTGNQSGKQSYIMFVVRDDLRSSKILFESSVTTFQAYNFWPGGATGKSLYNWAPGGRSVNVSFNRPYILGASYTGDTPGAASGLGAGEYLTNLQPGPATGYPIPAAGFEYNMLRWLERNGYDVTYITNIDLHENGNQLTSHSAFLSVGHNEYWSMNMHDAVQNAILGGVNVGFFSSNTQYWQIRLEPGADGTADRTMICYKYDASSSDPLYNSSPYLATVRFREAPVNLPEAAMVGVEYFGDPVNSDIVISDASHWLLNGTGLQNGDRLTGLLGYEVDTLVPGVSPSNTSILATSPVGPLGDDVDNPPGFSCSTEVCDSHVTWYSTGHAFVFATGSMYWSWGLDDYNAPGLRPSYLNAPAQQITKNVLSSFIDPVAVSTSSLPSATVDVSYTPYQLHATGGGQPYTWSASGLPAGMQLSSSGVLDGKPTSVGNSTVSFTVTDDAGKSAVSSLGLTVAPPEGTIVITISSLPPGVVGRSYSQSLAAMGGTPPYRWSLSSGSLPGGLTLSTAGVLAGTPTAAGTFNFTAQVRDATGITSSRQLQLTVNVPLSVSTSSLSAGTVGIAYSRNLSAIGGTSPYQWSLASGSLPAGLSLSAAGVLSGTPTANGSFSFTLQVKDATAATATAQLQIAINAALAITTSLLPAGATGSIYSQTLAATGGSPPYQWSITAGAVPPGLVLATGGALTGTPTAAGTYTFTVQAKDAGGLTATKQLSAVINAALSIATTTLPSASVGTSYSQTFTANGGTAPYIWSVTAGALPPGMTLSTSGNLTGTPTAAQTYSFTVQVSDANSQTATQTFPLLVRPSFSIATATLPPGAVGSAYNQTLTASGGTAPYQWSLSGGSLPAGLSLNSAGTLAGTATTAGTSSFTIQAKDANAQIATKTFQLTINAALAIVTSSLPNGMAGSPYSQTLAGSGGTPPYGWTVSSGTLPAGLTLGASGLLAGTPTAAGTFTFTVQIRDAGSLSATRSLQLIVTPAVTISNLSLLPGVVGVAYNQIFAATGGTAPYAWSVAAGALPQGLTLSAAGNLTGTPTAAGSYNFTVQVRDANSQSASRAFQLAVNQPFAVTTVALAAGSVGSAYSQNLTASGGAAPYQWSLAAGSLPSGLALSTAGLLSGTPLAAGTFNLTVRVTDSNLQTATRALQLTVGGSTPVGIATTSLSNGIAGSSYSQTLAATGGVTPYRWSLTAGALPPGISLSSSGALTGSPTAGGSFDFTIQVQDANSQTASRVLSLPVAGALDNFLNTTTDSALWCQCVPDQAPGSQNSQIQVVQGNGQLQIQPLSNGTGYNGYASLRSFNMTSAALSAQVVEATSGSGATDTSFVLSVDGSNWYRFIVEGGQLYLQTMTAGAKAGVSVPFNLALQSYWRFRHDAVPNRMIFETSADGISWTAQWESPISVPIDKLAVGLNAGTWSSESAPGTAIFANLRWQPDSGTQFPNITPPLTLPAAQAGVSYSESLAAAGGTSPYEWSIVAGSLPLGLTLSPEGSLAGTVTGAAGTFTFAAQVKDNAGLAAIQKFQLTVGASLNVATATLADGTTGVSYSQSLTAAGGISPYQWSVASGSLPAGLTLSPAGSITGTPSLAGTANFTVQVRDSASGTATRPLQIVVSTAATYTIAGTITQGSAGLAGVRVALSSGASATTGSTGAFSFTGLGSGTYTVTPSLSGFSFAPPSRTFSNITSNQTANFAATTVTATARAISIDFTGGGTPMAATETAGVVAKTNWNNAAGNVRTTPLSLVDETGASTGATVTWSSDNNWALPVADAPGNVRMMRGYLDTGAENPTTVTVSGLPVSATGYDIYVYSDGDNEGSLNTASYAISGTGISTASVNCTDSANTNFNGSLNACSGSTGNYIKFTAINATAFTLTATPRTATDGALRAEINGIQVVPAAIAATYTIAGTITQGSAGLAGVRVALSSGASATTGSTGAFSFTGLGSGTYTVTPSLSGFSFTPPSRTFSNITSNQTANFAATTVTATARAISIDFTGGGTPMAATETAGVVAKTNWNNAAGNVRTTPLSLVDETGASTGATVTWSSDNNWALPIADAPGNVRLMRGYLDTGAENPTTVTVSGLPVSATGYDIYVYTDGDNAGSGRTAIYTISGTGIPNTSVNCTDAANTNFGSGFTPCSGSIGNYVKFTINATAFTLTAVPGASSDSALRAAVNGIQIVPAAIAATYTIAGTITQGSAGLAGVGIALSSGASATTGSTGTFSFTGLGSGTYTVTPSLSGFSFTPPSRTFSNITSNQTANFAATTVTATARAISIDFTGGGTPMAATETAGAVAKTNWNNAAGNVRTTPLSLVDETGASTGATATWSSDNNWALPIADTPGNVRMMRGYLDTGAENPTTVTVSGLPVSATGYDIYVYTDGDNEGSLNTASYAISGTGISTASVNCTDSANTNFNGSLNACSGSTGNYIKFTAIDASAFTLTATPRTAADGALRAEVNGIQIAPH